MGLTKSELFTKSQNETAQVFKTLGHPARIAIIEYLLNANACITGDLVEELGLSQPTISQHLKELKAIGIIQGTIEGTRVNYCINPLKWKEITEIANTFFNKYNSSNACC